MRGILISTPRMVVFGAVVTVGHSESAGAWGEDLRYIQTTLWTTDRAQTTYFSSEAASLGYRRGENAACCSAVMCLCNLLLFPLSFNYLRIIKNWQIFRFT